MQIGFIPRCRCQWSDEVQCCFSMMQTHFCRFHGKEKMTTKWQRCRMVSLNLRCFSSVLVWWWKTYLLLWHPGCEWHKSRRWLLPITKFKDVMILKWHPLVTSKRALFVPNTMKRWWRLWSKTEVLTYVILHERNVLIRLTICDNIFRSVDFVPIYSKQASNRVHFHERYFHTWQWNDFWHC